MLHDTTGGTHDIAFKHNIVFIIRLTQSLSLKIANCLDKGHQIKNRTLSGRISSYEAKHNFII